MPSFEISFLSLFGLIVATLASTFFDSLPRAYRDRGCQGKHWRRRFPDQSKVRIRGFLDCFIDGMSFDVSHRLKFSPDDHVFEVYRAIYGGRVPLGDDMECERFSENLSEMFGCPLEVVDAKFHEAITLGELFDDVVCGNAA